VSDSESLAEKTIASETAFEGRLLRVRIDTVALASGRRTTREVIEHPGAVAIVPVLEGERLLLVRQFRQPAGRVLLEIPAGTLDPGELPEECARRELGEETGYRPGRLIPLYRTYLAPGYSSEMLHCFLGLDLAPVEGHPDADENVALEVVTLAEAEAMLARGEINDAKTLCGLLMARQALESSEE
jgi:8-oxo-dGTP pyrophosphatase MutT (NUDIX family)